MNISIISNTTNIINSAINILIRFYLSLHFNIDIILSSFKSVYTFYVITNFYLITLFYLLLKKVVA